MMKLTKDENVEYLRGVISDQKTQVKALTDENQKLREALANVDAWAERGLGIAKKRWRMSDREAPEDKKTLTAGA